MHIKRTDLDWAATQGLITNEQAVPLWEALEQRYADQPRFDLAHVAYYTGALIVISAMGWFMTLAWEQFGGAALFGIALAYAVCFALAGRALWSRPAYKVPGGLLVTLAVCMTPLAVYGLQRWAGIWPQDDPGHYRDYHLYIRGGWIAMEIGTILVAAVALRFVRFPFLTAPIAFSLWYMSMDLAPLIFGQAELGWNERLWVSLVVGLLMILVSYVADRRTQEDYAFWGYLFGVIAFWGGLSLMEDGGELGYFLYALVNVGLMFVSVLLMRRVFMVFGALGVFGYLGHLAYVVFEDSILFPFALTALGLGVIGLGMLYQRNRPQIEQTITRLLPTALLQLRPTHRM